MSKQNELAQLADAVTVDGSNVGIGTSSPTSLLHLHGTYPKITLNDETGVDRAFSVGTNNETFTIRNETSSSDGLTISNANLVGIGTSSGTAPLEISNSSANSLRLHRAFATNSASSATIRFAGDDSAGNVTDYAEIRSYTENVANGSEAGALLFGTRSSGSVTERMRIDSSGRVTKPYHPYASASSSSVTSTNNIIPLNAYNVYNGGMNIDNTNQRFTVPIAGHYVIGYHHLSEVNGTDLIVRKNGSNINGLRTQAQVSSNGNFSAQGILALAANDYIDFRVHWGRTHGNASYNSMYVYLIG